MNLNRRDFNIIGASIPLGSLLASGYPIEPEVEPMRMATVVHIWGEWIRDNDWEKIYDALEYIPANERYSLQKQENSERLKLIVQKLVAMTGEGLNKSLLITIWDDGEITWGEEKEVYFEDVDRITLMGSGRIDLNFDKRKGSVHV